MISIFFALSTLVGLILIGWRSPNDAPKIFITGAFIVLLAALGMMVVA